jgi:hypothetical protein
LTTVPSPISTDGDGTGKDDVPFWKKEPARPDTGVSWWWTIIEIPAPA